MLLLIYWLHQHQHVVQQQLVPYSSVHHIMTRLLLHNFRLEPHHVSVGSAGCTSLQHSARPETGVLHTVPRLCDRERLSLPCCQEQTHKPFLGQYCRQLYYPDSGQDICLTRSYRSTLSPKETRMPYMYMNAVVTCRPKFCQTVFPAVIMSKIEKWNNSQTNSHRVT